MDRRAPIFSQSGCEKGKVSMGGERKIGISRVSVRETSTCFSECKKGGILGIQVS